MSTPNHLAHLATGPRRQALRMLERTRIADAVQSTREEAAAARKALHSLTQALETALAGQNKLTTHSLLYPPSEDRDAQRALLAREYAQLLREHRRANAFRAAANVVHESAVLERAWAGRPDPAKTDGRLLANVLFTAVSRFVIAPGYTVTVSHPDTPARDRQLWREMHHGTVKRSRARSILETWAERDQTYILRDPHGRFYVATPTRRLEFVPADIAPPHSAGDALRAALAAHYYPAYEDSEDGLTWLSMPLEPSASREETRGGPHFRILTGERADRPASQYDERWTASFYAANGEYVTTLRCPRHSSTLAEDCAHIARAIAEFVPPQH